LKKTFRASIACFTQIPKPWIGSLKVSGIFLKLSRFLLLAVLCIPLWKCATAPQPTPSPEPLPRAEERFDIEKSSDPRILASLQFTEQARLLIQEGKPDQAIRTLERALNLYPANGETYYYLAEAWLMKGNIRQAKEFHGFAATYLRDHPQWRSRLNAQQEKISRRSRE
jgi:tetratricopeptide (TPR) repeat protein